jgi:hypothetical protein
LGWDIKAQMPVCLDAALQVEMNFAHYDLRNFRQYYSFRKPDPRNSRFAKQIGRKTHGSAVGLEIECLHGGYGQAVAAAVARRTWTLRP